MVRLQERLVRIICAVLVASAVLTAATFTVSKDGRGAFSSIQEAVAAAGPGDIVLILDNSVYDEQVTIDSTKAGLTLTSSNPTSMSKPTIRYKDMVNVGPKTCREAKVDSLVTFDRNGALRLLGASNVTINGVKVDGGGAFPFGYNGIWSTDNACLRGTCFGSACPLFHGNAAVTVWLSGDATIRNCDIGNAYFGINVKDRNQGGIYGNPNPSDNTPWLVVPLSGFGRTGNHLIESNRIHNNSFGLFFESSWDLGSTIRYNLIYENYHQTDAIASLVKSLPDGNNEGGGAIKFKDDMLSPLAIYNNTFWHNFMIFFAHWQVGAQHLVFNNIYGQPFKYWGSYADFSGLTYMELMPKFVNRMKNCVLAAQQQRPPSTPPFYSVQVMNGMQVQQTGGLVPPGSIINSPYPVDAEIRWLETPFKSTVPTDPRFLVPNWDDTLVQRFIRNKGWVASGVKNPDGSIADLGAIPFSGVQTSVAVIRPTTPVVINGTTATMRFNLKQQVGTIRDPKIVYFRFIKNVVFQPGTDYWSANGAPVIPATSIIDIPKPATPITFGENSISVTVPARLAGEDYAFFELIVEGTDSEGKKVNSSVGFLPYRRLDYKFVVEIWNLARTTKLTEVRAGDPVILKISAFRADGSAFSNTVQPVDVRLLSGFDLLVPGSPPVILSIPNGVTGWVEKTVVFTKIPAGGLEYVNVAGKWNNSTQDLPFFGTSDGITILPGPPDKVVFQDPPSTSITNNPTVIDPGIQYSGIIQVYDSWENMVDQQVQVQVSSLKPAVGNVVGGARTILTDSSGRGTFKIEVTDGKQDSLFTLQAILPGKNTDTAIMKVGKPRDKLWIFYSDTLRYDPLNTLLEGQLGDRKRITIIVAPVPVIDSAVTTTTGKIVVEGTPNLQFYASPTDSMASSSFTLVNGRADVWVTSLVKVDNGMVFSLSDSIGAVLPSDLRRNIYFTSTPIVIDSAFYYADNGYGQVDRAEIYFRTELAAAPDSIALHWPAKTADNRITVLPLAMTLGSDNRHITITLPTPFDTSITSGEVGGRLGTAYDRPNNQPEVPIDSAHFAIRDRLGMLIMSAAVVERIQQGADTIYVTFSEDIDAATLIGASFILVHQGAQTTLSVSSAIGSGSEFRLIIPSQAIVPIAGDSLRINPAGPLADTYGNRAHLQNRPVLLSVRPIPAGVVSANYKDHNADGIVETVIIRFGKNVKLSDLVLSLDWGGETRAENVGGTRLFRPNSDSSVVGVDILGSFSTDPGLRTSGVMFVTVSYLDFPGQARGATVQDSAAPVILSAHFTAASLSSASSLPYDTLDIEFSESVASVGGFSPFLFYSIGNDIQYTMICNSGTLPTTGTQWSFLVSEINGTSLPANGDSIWIDPVSMITDVKGVSQINPANRRVAMDVESAKQIVWSIGVHQNPFNPVTSRLDGITGLAGYRGTAIVIKPLVRTGEDHGLSAKATIFDPLGNIILKDAPFVSNSSTRDLYLKWDGTNRQHRLVGTGSYIAVVHIRERDGTTQIRKEVIGVTR